MARNAIESDFRSSKMAASSHFVKKKSKKKSVEYWCEMARMRSKVIFSHPKWPPAAILWNKSVLIWNGKCNWKWFSVIQNGHRQPYYNKNNNNNSFLLPFCENKSCVLIWNDRKWFSVIINGPNRTAKMVVGGHFKKNGCILPFCGKKNCVLIWNGEKCDRKWFWSSKMQPFWMTCSQFLFKKSDRKWFSLIQNGRRQPFSEQNLKNILSCTLIWNGEKCNRKWFLVIQNGGGGGITMASL